MAKNVDIYTSKEAETVTSLTREFEILEQALCDVENRIGQVTGVEKQQLIVKKADLEIQQTINEARRSQATNRFNNKFSMSLSSDEIASRNESYSDASEKSREKWNKTADYLGKGANLLVDATFKLATISFDKEFETISARTDLLMADIDALSQKSILSAELTAKAYTSAIQSSIASLTDGINEGAYAAANSLIDLSAQSQILEMEKTRIELENKNTKQLRTEQRDATLSNLDAQKDQAMATIVSETTRIVAHAVNDVEIAGFSAGDAPGAVADLTASVAQGVAAANVAITQSRNKLIVQQYENQKRVTEAVLKSNQQIERTWIESAANVEKAWLAFAQKIENNLVKSEAAANDMGVAMGFNGEQLRTFKKTMFETQIAVAKWGKTLEDMQKIQNAYQDDTGRNIQFTTNDFDTSFALDKPAGQDGLSTQLTSGMEIFNHSVADSNEMIFEMYQNVSKIGLNGRKYMKDLVKNLKLAEKYQFKGGVKGLMEMAKWAQNTRFNMDSLDGMLSDIHSGGLEGLITKAAGMQVLGGGFAMGADPLAMGYEAYMDPKAYAQRMQNMMKGIGYFDSKTGEVNFNMADQMRLEQFAQLTGQSVEDVKNQRRQAVKGDRVYRNLRSDINWSDDDKALVTNKAQLVDGEWKVTMENGEQKAVSDLSKEDLMHLQPTNNEEKLVTYVYDIRDMMTQLTGAQQHATARLEAEGFEEWYSQELQRIRNVTSDFDTNFETYLSQFKEKMRLATEAQSTMLSLMGQGNSNIDSAASDIRREGQNIATSLSQANELIQSALSKINSRKDKWQPQQGEYAFRHQHVNPPTTSQRVSRSDSHSGIAAYGTSIFAKDAIAYGSGNPMNIRASKVMPIHDGAVAQTDPEDHAIFAKIGGPFDKLFDGVFGRINLIYEMMSEYHHRDNDPLAMGRDSFNDPTNVIQRYYDIFKSKTASIGRRNLSSGELELNMADQMRIHSMYPSTIFPKEYDPFKGLAVRDTPNLFSQGGQTSPNNTMKHQFEPIRIEGRLELTNSNGVNIDIMSELQNNPTLISNLTKLISNAISSKANGGRGIYNGGDLVSF